MRIAVLLTVLVYASVARALSTSLSSVAGSMSRRASAAAGSDGGIVTGTAGWLQKTITITAPSRGCHIITHEIEKQIPDLSKFQVNHSVLHCTTQATCTNSAFPAQHDHVLSIRLAQHTFSSNIPVHRSH
jgi:hypothetical protein